MLTASCKLLFLSSFDKLDASCSHGWWLSACCLTRNRREEAKGRTGGQKGAGYQKDIQHQGFASRHRPNY